jgi:5'(3')-deoxyribonucleotidase
MVSPWIGVDLDGTLAHYDAWVDIYHIGAPIKPVVDRVKKALTSGYDVKIFTARASVYDPEERAAVIQAIQEWCERHIGVRLEVTCSKDFYMAELWDDRARQVVHNTGKFIE